MIQPNLHPLIVHFVIAFLITGPVLLLICAFSSEKSTWRAGLQATGDWMLWLGNMAALAAVLAGLQAYYSVAHDGPSHAAMTDHRNWALVTVAVFLTMSLSRWFGRNKPPTLFLAVALMLPVGLLSVTGWKGAHLVYQYGIGVKSLPAVTGDGHDHEHAETADDDTANRQVHGEGHEERAPNSASEHRPNNAPQSIESDHHHSGDHPL